jgi:hypothetical protein
MNLCGSTTPSVSALEEWPDQLTPPIGVTKARAFPDSQDVDPALQQVGVPALNPWPDQAPAAQQIKQ